MNKDNFIVGMFLGGVIAGVKCEDLQYAVVENIHSMAGMAIIFYDNYDIALSELNTNIKEPDLSVYKLYMTILHGALHGLRRKELKTPKYYENLEIRTDVRKIIDNTAEKLEETLDQDFSKAWNTFISTGSFYEGLKLYGLSEQNISNELNVSNVSNASNVSTSKGMYGLLAGAYYGLDHFDDKTIKALTSDELSAIITSYLI
jgi:hypothetical protein